MDLLRRDLLGHINRVDPLLEKVEETFGPPRPITPDELANRADTFGTDEPASPLEAQEKPRTTRRKTTNKETP